MYIHTVHLFCFPLVHYACRNGKTDFHGSSGKAHRRISQQLQEVDTDNYPRRLGRCGTSPKGGTRVLSPPPPPFLTWFPLMWSLECLICFDFMEKLYLPPLSFCYLGETLIWCRCNRYTTVARVLCLVATPSPRVRDGYQKQIHGYRGIKILYPT